MYPLEELKLNWLLHSFVFRGKVCLTSFCWFPQEYILASFTCVEEKRCALIGRPDLHVSSKMLGYLCSTPCVAPNGHGVVHWTRAGNCNRVHCWLLSGALLPEQASSPWSPCCLHSCPSCFWWVSFSLSHFLNYLHLLPSSELPCISLTSNTISHFSNPQYA